MIFSSLEIENFRNLRHVALSCSPGLNLITGPNASGKTNLLEALYFLGRARSFRTGKVRELIHNDAASFRIVAKMSAAADARPVPVGVQRSLREFIARIDGAPIRSLAELARQTPVLLLTPGSHRLLEDGPQQRRRFMDWGLFHMDGGFLMAWRRFTIALRHRNAALRSNADNRSIDAWDEELVQAAATLDGLRKTFCEALQEALAPLIEATLGQVRVEVDHRRGWLEGKDLLTVLHEARTQDRQYGFTRSGPQRADFVLRLDGRAAPEHLSRGQQKLVVIALVLAQAQLYQAHLEHPCVLLIDDLPAELDSVHRARVMACLAGMDSQLFVTAIDAGILDTACWRNVRTVNIHAGRVDEVV